MCSVLLKENPKQERYERFESSTFPCRYKWRQTHGYLILFSSVDKPPISHGKKSSGAKPSNKKHQTLTISISKQMTDEEKTNAQSKMRGNAFQCSLIAFPMRKSNKQWLQLVTRQQTQLLGIYGDRSIIEKNPTQLPCTWIPI